MKHQQRAILLNHILYKTRFIQTSVKKKSAVGVNKLNSLMNIMAEKGGLEPNAKEIIAAGRQ